MSKQQVSLSLICVLAEDWYELVDFYVDVIGLSPVDIDESKERALLKDARGLSILILSGGEGQELPKGPKHNSFYVSFVVNDLPAMVSELEYRGVVFWQIDEGILAVMDPDGNLLYLSDENRYGFIPDGWLIREKFDLDAYRE